MQSVEWVTFAVSNSISRTVIHFFPSAQVTSAPYPVIFKLHVFGKDVLPKSVALEGGRLGQPDGVRLTDAFPHLAEGVSGLIGLHVEVSTPQPRIDLSPSHCVIELVSSAQSVRFVPRQSSKADKRSNSSIETKGLIKSFPGINDAFFQSSLAIVNSGDTQYPLKLISPRPRAEALECTEISSDAVLPSTVQEIQLHEGMFTDCDPEEYSWGLLRGRIFEVVGEVPDVIKCFAIFRDTLTKRVISVTQL